MPYRSQSILLGALVVVGLYLSSLYSYLLFHSLAEMFSIAVAWVIFFLAWNVRRYLPNSYLLFLGIAYACIGFMDILHLLAYKGMGVFPEYGANLPTQLWIGARYLESLTLLVAPLFFKIVLPPRFTFGVFFVIAGGVVAAIFTGVFPDCYIEGSGLTVFKKSSEYAICLILVLSAVNLYRHRTELDERVFRLVLWSIILTIGSELAFTFYVSVYDFSNLVGHFLKIFSFFLVYKAIVEKGLSEPFDVLFRELKSAKQASDEVSRAKGEFLAWMSHELRTPMNAVIGLTELTLQSKPTPEQREYLEKSQDSARSLVRLVDDILDFSSLESGNLKLAYVEFDLDATLRAVGGMFAFQAEKKGVAFSISVSPGLPHRLKGDPDRLRLVLVNLLGNAFKFTECGSISLDVQAEEDTHGSGRRKFQFVVKDTGIGVPKTVQAAIFESYQQADGEMMKKYGGSGLGLTISKRLVEMMGGEIRLESEPGKGSVFFFSALLESCSPPEKKNEIPLPGSS